MNTHTQERQQKIQMNQKIQKNYILRERPYQKLIAWQEAHKLCIEIYSITKTFFEEEKFGLIPQMRRSSYSVATNLAEGNGRRSSKDQAHFCVMANASLEELHYQCLLAKDLKYISLETFERIDGHIQRVGYLITKLRSSLL